MEENIASEQHIRNLTFSEAVKYCESHECKDCKIMHLSDCRTTYEKQDLHYPCFINLMSEEEKRKTFGGKSDESK